MRASVAVVADLAQRADEAAGSSRSPRRSANTASTGRFDDERECSTRPARRRVPASQAVGERAVRGDADEREAAERSRRSARSRRARADDPTRAPPSSAARQRGMRAGAASSPRIEVVLRAGHGRRSEQEECRAASARRSEPRGAPVARARAPRLAWRRRPRCGPSSGPAARRAFRRGRAACPGRRARARSRACARLPRDRRRG